MNTKPLRPLLAALSLFCPLAAFGQAGAPGADPFLKSNSPPAAAAEQSPTALPREGLVRMEVFSLSLEDGRAATRKFPKQADLYAWLGEELEQEKPTVNLERLMVLRVRGGQRSKLQEIDEYPYPTEFESPQIPQNIGIGQPAPVTTTVTVTTPTPPPAPPNPPTPPAPSGAKGDTGPPGTPAASLPRPAGSSPVDSVMSPWPYTATTPLSFEVKNSGWTFEVEMTISDNGPFADLSMAPAFVRLCGLEIQSPSGEVMQPYFEASKMATQVLTKIGQPTLVGTFSPPVDTGVGGGNIEPLTRLLFITVTKPR